MIGNIPDGWRVEKLGQCVDILDNKRIPLNNQERENRIRNKDISTLYPYYGATQQAGFIDDYIFDEELVLLGEDGVMFYDKDKPKAYIINGRTWVNNHAHVLRAKSEVTINKYLLNYLNTFHYKGFVTGATRLKLNQSRMAQIPIPIPPLQQQEKIVKVLDISSELIEKQKELIAKYDLFLKSKFIEMFGDPISNPMGWEVVKLGTLGQWKGGGTPSRKKLEYFNGNIPWITTTSLGKLYINKNHAVEYITNEAIENSATKIIPINSIIIGTRVGVGKVSINKDELCSNQDIMSLTNIIDISIPIYIYYYINFYNKILKSQQRGATIQGITAPVLKELNTPIPPLTLQNKFASIVEKIETIKTKEAQKLEHLEILHKSLMDRAFKGEIG